jgi:hypothetical protein
MLWLKETLLAPVPQYGRWSNGACGWPTAPRVHPMNELVFEIAREADGGLVAEALGESIFTQADSLG